MNTLLWAVFPYVALTLFFVVPFIRLWLRPYAVSTRASSMFARDLLGAASLLLHWGLLLAILGHLAGLVGGIQGWGGWIGAFFWLATIGGILALAGSVIALARRLAVPEVRALSQSDDYLVHVFLIAIIGIALYQGMVDRIWGVAYPAGAWFASLWRFQPEPGLMAAAPLLSKLHITLAFMFAAYFPFTKLVHMWTLPVNYLVRPYQSMRTAARKFQQRWEFKLRSDQSVLSYAAATVVAVFATLAFVLPGPLPEAVSKPSVSAPGQETASMEVLQEASGYRLFVSQCARCHGLDGKAEVYSRYSPRFAQPPRDLAGGVFRFVSTRNRVASEADVRHVITHGLPPAGMPAFGHLPAGQIDRLIDVLDSLREKRQEPGPRIEPGPAPDFDRALIRRGEELYQLNCAVCHGEQGRGDGPAAAALPVPPANLAAGRVKAGADPIQLYYRIAAGIPGDEMVLMPGFGHLERPDIWAIVAYLRAAVLPPAARRESN